MKRYKQHKEIKILLIIVVILGIVFGYKILSVDKIDKSNMDKIASKIEYKQTEVALEDERSNEDVPENTIEEEKSILITSSEERADIESLENKKVTAATNEVTRRELGNNELNREDNRENKVEETEPKTIGTGVGGAENQASEHNGYAIKGYIEIPKTNIRYPISGKIAIEALETSVGILYPENATLNSPGNVVIIGHNYRNGKLFSNNKQLSIGDKIYITDETGTKLTYTIYEKFETTPEDTRFIARDTNGAKEISLSTCTDNEEKRLILLARAD